VYASRADLDAWIGSRNLRIGQEKEGNAGRRARPDKRRGRRPCLGAGEAWEDSESRQVLEHAIETGRGEFT
jgi:hypothetical protein